MNTYREILSDKELSILKGMIGLELNAILTPSISTKMGSGTYTLDWSASFSFNLLQKNSFVIFTNHYKETNSGGNYWKIQVEEAFHPKNIGHEKEDFGYVLTGNLAMLNIWSTIKKISIYSVDIADDEEYIEYDAVLVFKFDNGQIIGMTHNVSLIELYCDAKQIEKITEHCFEKYCLS